MISQLKPEWFSLLMLHVLITKKLFTKTTPFLYISYKVLSFVMAFSAPVFAFRNPFKNSRKNKQLETKDAFNWGFFLLTDFVVAVLLNILLPSYRYFAIYNLNGGTRLVSYVSWWPDLYQSFLYICFLLSATFSLFFTNQNLLAAWHCPITKVRLPYHELLSERPIFSPVCLSSLNKQSATFRRTTSWRWTSLLCTCPHHSFRFPTPSSPTLTRLCLLLMTAMITTTMTARLPHPARVMPRSHRDLGR